MIVHAVPKGDFTVVYVDSPNPYNELFSTFRCSFVENPAEETGMNSDYFDLAPYVLDPFTKNSVVKEYKRPDWERDDVTNLWYNRKIYMDKGHYFQYDSTQDSKTLSYEMYVMEETDNINHNIFHHIPAQFHPMNSDNYYFVEKTQDEINAATFLSEGHGIEYIKYKHPLKDYIGVSYGAAVLTSVPLSVIYSKENGFGILNFKDLTDEFQGQIDLLLHAFAEDNILLQNIHNNQLFTIKIKHLKWEIR